MSKTDYPQQTAYRFPKSLEAIHNRVLAMGGLVEQQLGGAITALLEGDAEAARQVVEGDHAIDALELALDEECVHILARRQPAASDLRLVIAVIKTITDLERIGDEAERIGRMAVHLGGLAQYPVLKAEVASLGESVRRNLSGALNCFARLDVEQAVTVARQDAAADRQYDAILRQLTDQMMRDPASVPRMMDLMWVARSLERIGDRSRNICEYVIYLVRGKDVRHTHWERVESD